MLPVKVCKSHKKAEHTQKRLGMDKNFPSIEKIEVTSSQFHEDIGVQVSFI